MEMTYESFVPFSENGMIGRTPNEIKSVYDISVKIYDDTLVFLPGTRFTIVGDYNSIRKLRSELDLW